MKGRSCLWLVALLAALSPRPASGQVSLAIVDVSLQGELQPLLIEPVSRALEQGIRDAALAVVMPDVVAETLRQAGLDTRCVAGSCLGEIGALTNVEVLLRARLEQQGQHYDLEIELLLARDGSRLGRHATSCDVCTWAEALASVTRGAAELRSSMPGLLTLEVSPPDAALSLDGRQVDPSRPLAVAPGRHVIRASTSGRQAELREVTVAAGETSDVSIALGSLERSGPRERRPLQIAGWVAGGLALVSLVPGALWLALDGSCPTGSEDSAGTCAEPYHTFPEGLALTVASGVLAVSAVVLFLVDWRLRRRRAPAAALAPIPLAGGGILAVGGLF